MVRGLNPITQCEKDCFIRMAIISISCLAILALFSHLASCSALALVARCSSPVGAALPQGREKVCQRIPGSEHHVRETVTFASLLVSLSLISSAVVCLPLLSLHLTCICFACILAACLQLGWKHACHHVIGRRILLAIEATLAAWNFEGTCCSSTCTLLALGTAHSCLFLSRVRCYSLLAPLLFCLSSEKTKTCD